MRILFILLFVSTIISAQDYNYARIYNIADSLSPIKTRLDNLEPDSYSIGTILKVDSLNGENYFAQQSLLDVKEWLGLSTIEEKVLNGGFDSTDYWTAPTGWTIADGVATCSGTAISLIQDSVLTPNKTVTISFDGVRTSDVGTLYIRTYTTTYAVIANTNADGHVSITYTVPSNSIGRLYITPLTGWLGYIDNVSIIEEVTNEVLSTTNVMSINEEQQQGLKVQNTLSKLMGRMGFSNDTVRISVLGDSRSYGTGATHESGWFYLDSLWLTEQFPYANIVMENWSYGSYYLSHMHTKYFEDISINPNVDLFIFHEYENETKLQLTLAEQIIKKIRSESTADIIINIPNPKTTSSTMYIGREYYYSLAQRYNCEIWDVMKVFYDEVAEGDHELSYFMSDDTHPNAYGYSLYSESFKNMFDTTKTMSTPNYANDAIEYYEFESGLMFLDSTQATYAGTWGITAATDSASGYVVYSTTASDTLTMSFDGTGFDLFYLDDATGGDINIKIDNTVPSAIRVNSRPLEYATPIIWDDDNSNADRDHRLFKAIVKDTTTLGLYTILISDSANSEFELYGQDKTDQVTNGDMSSATGWTVPAGWTISGGVATASGTSVNLTQDSVLTPGKTVTISFDGVRTSGAGSTLLIKTYDGSYSTILNTNADGHVSFDYTVIAGSNERIYFTPQTGWTGTIDNVKIEEPTLLGTGDFTTDFTSDNGDIFIPKTYAFSDNWLGEETYSDGDKFYFTVKRNWFDTIDNDGVENQRRIARVYGLENKSHTLEIVTQNTGTVKLDAIKFFRPILGRQ